MERAVAREHLVEDRAEGEEVAAGVGRPSAHLLRRHVADRSEDDSRLGPGRRGRQIRLLARALFGVRQLREAEVEDLQPPVLRDEEVLRLQVAVDDPLLVRRGKPVRHLERVVDRLARREPSAGEGRAQRLTFQKLADDVRRPFMRADVVDRRDVGMIEQPRRLRLLLEPPQPVRVVGEGGRQNLNRHLAREPRVPCAIHLTHPSGAEGREDLIWTKLAAGRDRHLKLLAAKRLISDCLEAHLAPSTTKR